MNKEEIVTEIEVTSQTLGGIHLKVGDQVDYDTGSRSRTKVTIIGFFKDGNRWQMVVTWPDCSAYFVKNYRTKYGIGEEWADDVPLKTTSPKFVTKIYWKETGASPVTTTDLDPVLRKQIRAAAWGEDKHQAPPGAPFEFL